MMTLEQMKERFIYDPITGDLYLTKSRKEHNFLRKVVSISTDGYLQIRTKEAKRSLLAHRVIYQIYYNVELGNDDIIEHIDQNKLNTKIDNLKLSTRAVNNKNLALRKTNKSGCSGVSPLPSGRWRVQIRVNKKTIHLGCFDTLEQAKQIKKEANSYYGFSELHN